MSTCPDRVLMTVGCTIWILVSYIISSYWFWFTSSGINWQVKPSSRTASGHTCFNKSLSTVLILRGKDALPVDTSMFSDPNIYSSWMPTYLASSVARQPRMFCGYEKTAALLSNSCATVRPLNHILDKAWNMFSSRAYVHQYLKHGLTEEDFLDSFVSLEKIIASYNNLWYLAL